MTKSVGIASSKCVCAALRCLKDLLCIWRRHAFDNAGTMKRCPAPERHIGALARINYRVVGVDGSSMLQQFLGNVWARWALTVFWVLDALWAFSRGPTGRGFLALAFLAGSAWLVYIKLSGRSRLSTR